MSVEKIDETRCTGCGLCVMTCPMDVFRLDKENKLAVIQYPEDCMLCGRCLIDCPEDAVTVSPEKKSNLILSWG